MIRFLNKATQHCLFARVPYFHYLDTRVDVYGFAKKEDAKCKKALVVPMLHVTEEWKAVNLKKISSEKTEGTWGVVRGFIKVVEDDDGEEDQEYECIDVLLLGSFNDAYSYEMEFVNRCLDGTSEFPSIIYHLATITDWDAVHKDLETED